MSARVRWFMIGLVVTMTSWATAARAEIEAADADFGSYAAVSDEDLNGMRGGFLLAEDGVSFKINFGLRRETYINGELVASSTLSVEQVGVGLQGMLSNDQLNQVNLVQNGLQNTFVAGQMMDTMRPSFATVIQNSLDGQMIRNVNVIDAQIQSLDLARASALQSSFTETLVGTLQ